MLHEDSLLFVTIKEDEITIAEHAVIIGISLNEHFFTASTMLVITKSTTIKQNAPNGVSVTGTALQNK